MPRKLHLLHVCHVQSPQCAQGHKSQQRKTIKNQNKLTTKTTYVAPPAFKF